MDVSLVMFKADGNRRDFPVRKDRVVIGRKNTCDLRIPLTSVSRQHCEIRVIEGVAKIRDLGSSNGTYHNHTRVQESVLSPGDEIVVGPVVFIIQINGMPEDIEPVRTIIENSQGSSSHASIVHEDAHLSDDPAGGVTQAPTEAREDIPETSDTPDPLTSETVDVEDPLSELQAYSDDLATPKNAGKPGHHKTS